MSLVAGTISTLQVGSNEARLISDAPSGGTEPYNYQWHKSTTSGFSPGSGNEIAGATEQDLHDTNLVPNVTYYYKLVVTDSATPAAATVTSNQAAIVTTPAQGQQNSFNQESLAGKVDLAFSPNTHSVIVDETEQGQIYPGQPVKVVASRAGKLHVVKCSANSDECFGFANYDVKSKSFKAGEAMEVSSDGNIISIYANGVIPAMTKVKLNLVAGGVIAVSGSGGQKIVGKAYDDAKAPGDLIRIYVQTLFTGVDA